MPLSELFRRPLLALLLTAGSAGAEAPPDRIAAFEAAFSGWLDDVGGTRAVMALRYDDAPAAVWTRGQDAGDPVDLASLSKAITAVCVASLVDDGLLAYDTPAAEVLDLPQAGPVTIGALLSHATGLEKDHTQGPMSWWKDDPTPRWAEITPDALDPARIEGDGEYHYSNENYAVLGTVIERITGLPYETACHDRALDPAGADGAASDRFAAYLPWGGWQMSAADYAAFMDYAYGLNGVLTRQQADLPEVAITGPIRYSMGMIQREMGAGRGRNKWHFGSLCFFDGPNLGSYTISWETGWTLTAWYDVCLIEPEMVALDQALVRVAYGLD